MQDDKLRGVTNGFSTNETIEGQTLEQELAEARRQIRKLRAENQRVRDEYGFVMTALLAIEDILRDLQMTLNQRGRAKP